MESSSSRDETKLRPALKAVLSYAHNKDAYFADALKSALDSNDHDTIIRIIIWRSEIDLNRIKITFNNHHGNIFEAVKKLKINVRNDVGNEKYYIETLCALLREEEEEERNKRLKKNGFNCDF